MDKNIEKTLLYIIHIYNTPTSLKISPSRAADYNYFILSL